MDPSATPSFSLPIASFSSPALRAASGGHAPLACAGAGADVVVGVRKDADGADLIARIGNSDGARSRSTWIWRISGTRPRRRREGPRPSSAASTCWSTMSVGPRTSPKTSREEDFDLTVNINLKGTFFATQAVGQLMIAQKSGRIVNISSQAGTVVLKGEAIYCMTKARHQSPDPLPRLRMGRPQDHRQQRLADASSGPTARGRRSPIRSFTPRC